MKSKLLVLYLFVSTVAFARLDIDFAVTGYNECLIMYVLAAVSPTHGVAAEVYQKTDRYTLGLNGEGSITPMIYNTKLKKCGYTQASARDPAGNLRWGRWKARCRKTI